MHAAQGRLQGFHCDVQEQLGGPESASKNLSQISTEQPVWTVPLAVYWHQRQLILLAVPFFILRLRNASGRCFALSRIATLAHAARPGPTSPGPSAAPGPQAGPDSESEGQAAGCNLKQTRGPRRARRQVQLQLWGSGWPATGSGRRGGASTGQADPSGQGQSALGDLRVGTAPTPRS